MRYAGLMKVWHFDQLLTSQGWRSDMLVSVDEQGSIVAVENETVATYKQAAERVTGPAIAGLVNSHSHAFQYAMAGLAEHLVDGKRDDFWSWRESMYRLALSVDPDHVRSIAAWLYSNMVKLGYTEVVEFHYLHHDRDGRAYADIGEMGVQLCVAAKMAGIRLTLVPVFYQQGGFDQPANERQRRFLCKDLTLYWELVERLGNVTSQYGAKRGVGLHSLRAADELDIVRLFEEAPKNCVRHLHIAEQQIEVDQCLDTWGSRPIEWLMKRVEIDRWFNLVHATHIQNHEIKGLTAAEANIVICPTTEANLGDGFFPLVQYQKKRGHWSIGSDSHVCLNPAEELRLLDYGQRLLMERRNVLCRPAEPDSGELLYRHALLSGRRSMGEFGNEYFQLGQPFSALVFDATHPWIATRSQESLLSSWIYAFDESMLFGTIVGNKWLVKQNRHCAHESLQTCFVNALQELANET